MILLSASSLAGLLALQGSFAAAGHSHARHEALHAIEHHRHHAKDIQHKSRADTSPFKDSILTRDAQTSWSGLVNKRSFDDVPTKEKRGTTCSFPTNAGLVAVTPNSMNGGWAIPPDQACTAGMYCPYACPPGQVIDQWDPSATSYTYPASMNGGLKCNSDGTVSKPFPDRDYCVDATGLAQAVDKTGKGCAFCQTQLPGDESMVIPTQVQGTTDIAIPGPDYWAGTAAHYYINPPGVSTSDGCQWGSTANPYGNWVPYVAGGNQVSSGETFLKLGWNPIYLEAATPFRNEMPTWGVEIVCDGDGCNGLPCAIDPSKNNVNEMVGGQADGAGGGNFCVVTAPKGVKASIVVFEGSASSGSAISASSAAAAHSTTATPSPSATPSSTPAASSTSPASTTGSAKPSGSSTTPSSSYATVTSSAEPFSASVPASYSYAPHQMLMNETSSMGTVAATSVLPTSTKEGGAGASEAATVTSPIASAKASTGAAVANVVNVAAVAGAMLFAAAAI